MATADLPFHVLHDGWDEDSRMGEMMVSSMVSLRWQILLRVHSHSQQYSLPTKPNCHPFFFRFFRYFRHGEDWCDPLSSPEPRLPRDKAWGLPPISPDPRTGLIRLDIGWAAGETSHPWVYGPKRAVAWHYLKWDDVSPSAYGTQISTTG